MGFDEFGDYIPDVPVDWQDPWEEIPDYNTGGNAPPPDTGGGGGDDEEEEYATYADWFAAQPAKSQALVKAESEAKIQAEKAATDKAYAEKLTADKKSKKAKQAKQLQAEQIAGLSSVFGFVPPGGEAQANFSRNIPDQQYEIPTLDMRAPEAPMTGDIGTSLISALMEQKKQRDARSTI